MAKLTIEALAYDALRIFKANAPIRTKPLGPTKTSPYPGNLKSNAIFVRVYGKDKAELALSREAASYIDFTETRSYKPGWQQKSFDEFVSRVCAKFGGKISGG
jgi:hypothetical protein